MSSGFLLDTSVGGALALPEILMRRIRLLLLVCVSSSVFAQQLQVPEIEFQSLPNPLKFPADLYLGEAAGVAVNSKGHIFVLSRGNSTGPAYGAAASSMLRASSCEKLVTTCTPGLMRTPSRSIKRTMFG
jgi:hypothetical protein